MCSLSFLHRVLAGKPLMLAGLLCAAGQAWAGTGKEPAAPPAAPASPGGEANWLTGENVSLGGVLFPHLHFQSVYGRTSSDLGHEMGAGHHDPVSDGWTVQGFELGLSARAGEHFEAFGTYHSFWENEDLHDYDGEFEEWFGKIKNLPGGLEVRGGKYLNRFGFHNATHLHAWDWLDNYLINGRLMGDDGLASIGGELSWNLPTPWTSVLSVSVGRAQHEAHAHEHGHGHEEEHAESFYEGEGAAFDSTLTTANWTHLWNYNDFHQFRGGISGAWGDNTWGRSTQVYGLHFQYEWRQNGLEPGGSYLRWRTEALFRRFDARAEAEGHDHDHEDGHDHHKEHGHEEEHGHDEPHGDEHHDSSRLASLDDWGFYTSLSYGQPLGQSLLEASLRWEYVSGVGEAGLAERWRVSPALTWFSNASRTFFIRGQYNHDNIQGHGAEDSAWIGFGFNWGGAEVR